MAVQSNTNPSRCAMVVISFDTELGWGAIESGLWQSRQKAGVYERTREVVPTLLDKMDDLGIPATWAFVGGLLERPGEHNLDHLPASARQLIENALGLGREDTFYAPDMIEEVRNRTAEHELACHTYAHVRFTYPGMNGRTVQRELANFLRVFPGPAEQLKSLVFPANESGFPEQVARSGFEICRVRGEPLRLTRTGRLLSSLLVPPSLSSLGELYPNLTYTQGSLFFDSGPRRIYRLPVVRREATLGLRYAIQNQGLMHLWNHPFNFGASQGLLRAFTSILEDMARYRDRGLLKIATMKQLRGKVGSGKSPCS